MSERCSGVVSAGVVSAGVGTILDAVLIVESSFLLSLAFAFFALGSFFLIGDENHLPKFSCGSCWYLHPENVESIYENEV